MPYLSSKAFRGVTTIFPKLSFKKSQSLPFRNFTSQKLPSFVGDRKIFGKSADHLDLATKRSSPNEARELREKYMSPLKTAIKDRDMDAVKRNLQLFTQSSNFWVPQELRLAGVLELAANTGSRKILQLVAQTIHPKTPFHKIFVEQFVQGQGTVHRSVAELLNTKKFSPANRFFPRP